MFRYSRLPLGRLLAASFLTALVNSVAQAAEPAMPGPPMPPSQVSSGALFSGRDSYFRAGTYDLMGKIGIWPRASCRSVLSATASSSFQYPTAFTDLGIPAGGVRCPADPKITCTNTCASLTQHLPKQMGYCNNRITCPIKICQLDFTNGTNCCTCTYKQGVCGGGEENCPADRVCYP